MSYSKNCTQLQQRNLIQKQRGRAGKRAKILLEGQKKGFYFLRTNTSTGLFQMCTVTGHTTHP